MTDWMLRSCDPKTFVSFTKGVVGLISLEWLSLNYGTCSLSKMAAESPAFSQGTRRLHGPPHAGVHATAASR